MVKIEFIRCERLRVLNLSFHNTVWKVHKFSVSQNLREINFWDCGSAKSAVLPHLETLCFDFLFFLKAEIYQINKVQSPKIGKNGNFRTSKFPKIGFT